MAHNNVLFLRFAVAGVLPKGVVPEGEVVALTPTVGRSGGSRVASPVTVTILNITLLGNT